MIHDMLEERKLSQDVQKVQKRLEKKQRKLKRLAEKGSKRKRPSSDTKGGATKLSKIATGSKSGSTRSREGKIYVTNPKHGTKMVISGPGKMTAFKKLIRLAEGEGYRRGGENTEHLVKALAEANRLGVAEYPESFIPKKQVISLSTLTCF